jgi:hypothetical protein
VEITPKKSVPEDRKIIDSHWFFACKDDELYRARYVAKLSVQFLEMFFRKIISL